MGAVVVSKQEQACSAVFGLPGQLLREMVRKGLGREVAKRWAEWLLDVLAVAGRLKLAFLHDYSVATSKEVQLTLTKITETMQISKTTIVNLTHLRCVGLPPHGDVMIIHKTATHAYLSTLLLEPTFQPWFIDVSGKTPTLLSRALKNDWLSNPDSEKEMCDYSEGWEGARKYFDWAMGMNGGESAGDVEEVIEGLCPTTLAGLLLGYPAVYLLGPDHSNCLAMVPLRLTTLTATLRCGETNLKHEHTICRFSIPSDLTDENWALHFQRWMEMMCGRAAEGDLWENLQFTQEMVTLNQVAL